MQKSKSKILVVTVLINLLVWAAQCGGTPTPIVESTPIPSGAEVINITEKETVTNKLPQQKTFDQCNSASPFKSQVQFSQSASEQSQQELVLGVTVGGEVGVSEIAKVTLEGAVEQHFATSKTNGQAHGESVAIEVPPYTKQEYNIVWQETRREGIVEYKENGVSKTADYSYRIGLELVSATGRDLLCPGQEKSTPTPLPTYTPFPTYTPPSPLPESSSPTPTVVPTTSAIVFQKKFRGELGRD